MRTLVTLAVIFTLILGFSLSGLLVISKLQTKNTVIKNLAFLLLGNVISIFIMASTIFIVWPT